jgi:hypothetical protein
MRRFPRTVLVTVRHPAHGGATCSAQVPGAERTRLCAHLRMRPPALVLCNAARSDLPGRPPGRAQRRALVFGARLRRLRRGNGSATTVFRGFVGMRENRRLTGHGSDGARLCRERLAHCVPSAFPRRRPAPDPEPLRSDHSMLTASLANRAPVTQRQSPLTGNTPRSEEDLPVGTTATRPRRPPVLTPEGPEPHTTAAVGHHVRPQGHALSMGNTQSVSPAPAGSRTVALTPGSSGGLAALAASPAKALLAALPDGMHPCPPADSRPRAHAHVASTAAGS